MTVERDKPVEDAAEQGEATGSSSEDEFLGLPDSMDERPVADVLEQSLPVAEDQVKRPPGSRAEASEADWIEQSVEVPLDEDEAER